MRANIGMRSVLLHAICAVIFLTAPPGADCQQRRTMANGGGLSGVGSNELRGTIGNGFYIASPSGAVLYGGLGVLTGSIREWEPNTPPMIRVSPNPTSNVVHIYSDQSLQLTDVIMTDVLGKEHVFKAGLDVGDAKELTIDVAALPAGWYIVNLRGPQIVLSTSLFIIR